jgi:hypothetical protein
VEGEKDDERLVLWWGGMGRYGMGMGEASLLWSIPQRAPEKKLERS